MATAEELEAELEVVRLEDELKAAKQTEEGPSRELKDALRAARAKLRAGREAATEEGAATVTPEPVEVEGAGE